MEHKPITCLILAAGYATRLYPLTENFPKPLLKVGDKSILDHLVDDIAGSGIVNDFVVISNHKFARHFQTWADTKFERAREPHGFAAPSARVVDDATSTNETRLGAVMDIKYAIDSLNLKGDFLIIAGDNVLDFSLQKFIQYSQAKNSSCIMRYYEPDETRLRKCGVLELAGEQATATAVDQDPDRVLDMEEKPAQPKSHWCCPPFYYYKEEDAARISEAIADGCGTDAPGSLAAWLCRNSTVHAMQMPGRRYDIGNLLSYEQVQKEYKGITNK